LESLPPQEQFVRSFVTWILNAAQVGAVGAGAESQAFADVLALSQRAGNVMLSFIVECNRAELWMRQGRLERAAATYQQALDRVTDARGQRLPIAGQALFGLGELARERGDLQAAARYLTQGIRLIEGWSEVGPLEGYICLARVRWAQGDRAGAWEAIETARRLAEDYDLTELDDLSVAIFQAWLWVAEGDWQNAERWARSRDLYSYIDAPLQEKVGDPYEHRMHKYELLVLARLLIAEGRPAEALQALEPLAPLAEWRERQGLLIECLALQALAWRAQGDPERALDVLARALAAAEPEGYLRVFVDEGEPMRALIADFRSRIAGRADAARLRAYADRLLAAYASPSAPLPPSPQAAPAQAANGRHPGALIEPLSQREREVLRYLRTPFSQPEIADRLYISVNTVRSHVKHIYDKLDVHSRTAAVERAEELGLLS
jgi:LuxR family maltose regulon positive regulatory protein